MTQGKFDKFMPKDPLMQIAWVDCLRWCCSDPMMLKLFEEHTGIKYSLPRSPIDAMIDKATGIDEHVFESFVKWFNEEVWGDVPAPSAGR